MKVFLWRKLIMEQHLSYKEQLLLFKYRGMMGIDEDSEQQINTIKIIGYYKLKQYSYVFWNKEIKRYENISFNSLVKRYYRDQSLKHEIFQAIGDIETALNNEISYILGKDDPYLYLNFDKWCQIRGRNKYIPKYRRQSVNKYEIKNEELSFLSQLQHQVKKSNYLDIQNFEKENDSKVFPTVWLMVNTLSFGQSIYLLKLMSPDRRKRISENFFHLKVTKLISDLELLNLIRNICCHNGDLVDISLKTMPKIPKKYRKYLNMDGDNYPHRLSVVITVLLDSMYAINPKYKFDYLVKRLEKICKSAGKNNQNRLAQSMGFKDLNAIKEMAKSFKDARIITFNPDGSYIFE